MQCSIVRQQWKKTHPPAVHHAAVALCECGKKNPRGQLSSKSAPQSSESSTELRVRGGGGGGGRLYHTCESTHLQDRKTISTGWVTSNLNSWGLRWVTCEVESCRYGLMKCGRVSITRWRAVTPLNRYVSLVSRSFLSMSTCSTAGINLHRYGL